LAAVSNWAGLLVILSFARGKQLGPAVTSTAGSIGFESNGALAPHSIDFGHFCPPFD